MDPIVVLKGALPPILAALLLVSVGGVRLLPLAMALGLWVAHGLLKAWPPLPHELWSDPAGVPWLLWGCVAAGLVALLEHLRVLSPRLAIALGAAVGATALWLVLQKLIPRWEALDVFTFVGGGGAAVILLALAGRLATARAPGGIASAVVWSTVLSIDAALITLANSAFLGQLCGAVAAAVGAAAGTSLWRRPFTLTAADGAWLGTAHALFVFAGAHLADLPWSAVGLALLAPCLLLLLPVGAAKRPLRWTIAAMVAVLVPLGIAGWLTFQANPPSGY